MSVTITYNLVGKERVMYKRQMLAMVREWWTRCWEGKSYLVPIVIRCLLIKFKPGMMPHWWKCKIMGRSDGEGKEKRRTGKGRSLQLIASQRGFNIAVGSDICTSRPSSHWINHQGNQFIVRHKNSGECGIEYKNRKSAAWIAAAPGRILLEHSNERQQHVKASSNKS
jgi:hypothetical protein